ncbi:MerR family transcriptional regulator [Dyadobacter tibetensis]|uniref:MerR family transcriptional regulator n=1 Tax=Dyadobacter tibetensis TaxID=1211851 RepID=UPI0004716F4C|nr:MerR family transcriptional regulator [Dyadobacter tibetensis]
MGSYSIKDLERLTNLKAHTIRIWEQRYNILSPGRTETNIRTYSDDDLKKILNVAMLVDTGMKISKIGLLAKEEIEALVLQSWENQAPTEGKITVAIKKAILLMTQFDQDNLDLLIDKLEEEIGLEETYEKFLYPLLVKSGLLWVSDRIIPAQEHFLSNIIRKRLFTAISSLRPTEGNGQTWILFLNEREDHEIGLLFSHYIISRQGGKVVYLGCRVPLPNLQKVVEICNPTHLCTFIVSNQSVEYIEHFLLSLVESFRNVKICVAGQSHPSASSNYPRQIEFINSIDALKLQLEQ